MTRNAVMFVTSQHCSSSVRRQIKSHEIGYFILMSWLRARLQIAHGVMSDNGRNFSISNITHRSIDKALQNLDLTSLKHAVLMKLHLGSSRGAYSWMVGIN